MKYLFSLLMVSLIPALSFGQEKDTNKIASFPNNCVYVEICGLSYWYGSVNYEGVFVHSKSYYLSGRVGIGFGDIAGTTGTNQVSIPLMLNNTIQLNKNLGLEIGVGTSIFIGSTIPFFGNDVHFSDVAWDPLLCGSLAARLQFKNGLFMRFGFVPLIDFKNDIFSKGFIPWFGLSFGYGFWGKNA